MKKILSILLTALMFVSLGVANVVAEGNVARVGQVEYSSLADAVSATQVGDTVEIMIAGEYTLPANIKNITIKSVAQDDVIINATGSGSIASIPDGATFEKLVFNFGNSSYHGFQHAGHIIFNNCNLNGLLFSYGNMDFNNCEFKQTIAEYCM